MMFIENSYLYEVSKNILVYIILLTPAIFFINFRHHIYASGMVFTRSLFHAATTSQFKNIMIGLYNSLACMSVHTLFSSYYSLYTCAYFSRRQIYAMYIGAKIALLFVFYIAYYSQLVAQSILLPLSVVTLALLIALAIIKKNRDLLNAAFFFALLGIVIWAFFNPHIIVNLPKPNHHVIILISVLLYLLMPSMAMVGLFLFFGFKGEIIQYIPYIIESLFLLFLLRANKVIKNKNSKVSRLHLLLILSSLVGVIGLFLMFYIVSIHIVYPLLLVVSLLYPPVMARFVEVFYPKRKFKEPNQLFWYGLGMRNHADLQLEVLNNEIQKKAALVFNMFGQLSEDLRTKEYKIANEKRLLKYEKITDNMQSEIVFFSEKLMEIRIAEESAKKLRAILKISDELESLADVCLTLYRMLESNHTILDNKKASSYIISYYGKAVFYYEKVFDNLCNHTFFVKDNKIFKRSMRLSQDLSAMRKEIALDIESGSLDPKEVANAMDWLYQIKKIKNCSSNIYQAQQGIR